ncbi:MAG: M23 family metallopeptidase [Deltaproteobacteria bacterium]|nr:M23 family metallopeptidase [Deltaproteobacteria bacterium]
MPWRRRTLLEPLPAWPERFGIRGPRALGRDLWTVLRHVPRGDRYTFGPASAGLLRPDLALPAFAGFFPADGIAPVFNFFDRTAGGAAYHVTVTRRRMRDWRGGRLSYDEHDGTDFVCPPGSPLCAAAPGVAVAVRDCWLRGGLTLCIDHGHGVVTQYSHLSRVLADLGAPVRRGEVVALSGHSSLDMTAFFPFVPPHIHFMVWVRGRPVDPYLAPGEDRTAGTWAHGNRPRTAAGPLDGDPPPPDAAELAVDRAALERALAGCLDPAVRAMVEAAASDAGRAALLEDSLHHDRPSWSEEARATGLRAPTDPGSVRLTLPLEASSYRSAAPADVRWTRP